MALSLQDTLDATNSGIISADNQTPQVELDYLSIMLAFLSTAQFGNFPVNSWEDGSPFKALLQSDSHALASISGTLYNVISGGILDLSTGQWLDFWGNDQYQEARNPAIQEVSYLWVTVASAVNLAAGELTVGAGPTQQFTTVVAVTDSDGNVTYQVAPTNITNASYPFTAQIIVQATDISPGSIGVVSAGDINTVVSPNVPGMTVTNAPPTSVAWELIHGQDAELDDAYRARLKTKWPSLALLRGSTIDAWGYWITVSDSKVARFNVLENTPQGGEVTIYVDPATEQAAVNLFINGDNTSQNPAHRPLCTVVHVYSSTTRQILISGNVYVPTNWLAQAKATFESTLSKYADMQAMGATIYLSTIIGFVQASSHVDHSESIVLNFAGSDVVLAAHEVPYFIDGLNWVGI